MWKGVYIKLLTKDRYQAQREVAALKTLGVALESAKTRQRPAVISPMIALGCFAGGALLLSACIPERQIEDEKGDNSCSILSESRVQVNCSANDDPAADPVLSRMGPLNLVPVAGGKSSHPLSVIVRASELLPNADPHPFAFVRIPASDTEPCEVYPKLSDTVFDSAALRSLITHHPADCGSSFDTHFAADFCGWDIQLRSLGGSEGENVRAQNMVGSQHILGDALAGCYYVAHESRTRIPYMIAEAGTENVKRAMELAAEEINTMETPVTSHSLKQILHRRGLNVRFEWGILGMLNSEKQKLAIRLDILLRAARRLVLSKEESRPGKRYRESVVEFLNRLLMSNESETEELRRSLFFSRLRMALFHDPDLVKIAEEPISEVILAARKNPRVTIEAAGFLFGVEFSSRFFSGVRGDSYYLLARGMRVAGDDVVGIDVRVGSPVSLREHSYLVLSQLIGADLKHIRLSQQSYCVTSREASENSIVASEESNASAAENYQTRRDRLPNKKVAGGVLRRPLDPTSKSVLVARKKPPLRKYNTKLQTANTPLSSIGPKLIKSAQTAKLFDRSATLEVKRCNPRVVHPSILFPAELYVRDESPQSALMAEYTLPDYRVLKEWNAYLRVLFEGLPGICGGETVMFEAVSFQLLACLCTQCSAAVTCTRCKQMRTETLGSLLASPILSTFTNSFAEPILSTITLSGLFLDLCGCQSDALIAYLRAFILSSELYGDPRGRGNQPNSWTRLLVSRMKGTDDEGFLSEIEDTFGNIHDNSISPLSPLDPQNPSPRKASQSFLEIVLAQIKDDNPSATAAERVSRAEPSRNQSGMLINSRELRELFGRVPGLALVSAVNKGRSPEKSGSVSTSAGSGGKAVRNPLWDAFLLEYGSTRIGNLEGRLFLWGSNESSGLGTHGFDGGCSVPRLCISLKNEYIKDVVCGHCCTFAVDVYGRLFSWGNNQFGQLGLGIAVAKTVVVPQMVRGIPPVRKLAVGNEHAVAVCENAGVYSWGNGDSGLLGHGDTRNCFEPEEIVALRGERTKVLACGGLHTILVTEDGKMFVWGRAEGGQLGLSQDALEKLSHDQGDYCVSTPIRLQSSALKDENVVSVACGEAHTLALTAAGAIFAWGFCNFGQLGLGFTSDTFEPGTGNYKSTVWIPAKVDGLAGVKVKSIVAGSTFSFFITDSGEVCASFCLHI